jgi:hypothetical protein
MRIAVTALIVSTMVGLAANGAEPISRYASPVKDIHVKSTVESRDMDVLKGISTEFAQSYRFSSSEFFYKEPSMLKLISKAGVLNVTYTINGNQKSVKAGWVHKDIDITHTPGQRQSATTVGLLTPSWLALMDVTSKGTAKLDGRDALIYVAHYKEEPKLTYYHFYVDPARKMILRQESYNGERQLKMSFRFSEPVLRRGIWVPTKTEVFNAEGKLGAVTRMQILGVNVGLADSVFAL